MTYLKIKKADGSWDIIGGNPVELDDTLTQSDFAADAKAVGDAIVEVKNSTVSYAEIQDLTEDEKFQARSNLGVYAQDDEPTDAEIGTLWIDTSSEGSLGGGGSSVSIDTTLTQAGMAADAKTVGDKFAEVNETVEGLGSWTNLKDKPFYSEQVVGVILEETTIPVTGSMYGLDPIRSPFSGTVSSGLTYNVIYNGAQYECVASNADLMGVTVVALGNLANFNGIETDDPFALFVVPDEMVESLGMYGGIMPLDGATEITVTITGTSEIIHKLDEKYVPMVNSFLRNGSAFGSLRGIDTKVEDEEYKMGHYAVATGYGTIASGPNSHAEGDRTKASDYSSHAEGYETEAASNCQHVQGRANIVDTERQYLHIVGNGVDPDQRSNAHTLDWDGNAWFQGDVFVGSTSGVNRDEGSKKLATEEYVNEKVESAGGLPETSSPYQQLVTNHNGEKVWEERTHYVEQVEGIVLEETEVVVIEDFGQFIIPSFLNPITEGKEYTITWNGEEYKSIAISFDMNGMLCIGLGNMSSFGGYESNEPFGIAILPSEMAELIGGEGVGVSYEGLSSAIVSITGLSQIIHKLDERFLPKISMKNIKDGIQSSVRMTTAAEEDNGYTLGHAAFAEGYNTEASGNYSHAEGYSTQTYMESSHAEGHGTAAIGAYSHAEGYGELSDAVNKILISGKANSTTYTYSSNSPISNPKYIRIGSKISKIISISTIEKTITIRHSLFNYDFLNEEATIIAYGAFGDASHAEGYSTQAIGEASHAEGHGTVARGGNSHAEGYITAASGRNSHAEGYGVQAIGEASHAEGYREDGIIPCTISGEANSVTYTCSVSCLTLKNSFILLGSQFAKIISTDDTGKIITLTKSLSEFNCLNEQATIIMFGAFGDASHAEGYNTEASGNYSHAEGYSTQAIGEASHTEGYNTAATENYSHAEGYHTDALGEASHAEGYLTDALGDASHAEGYDTDANGRASHAEGYGTVALADYQHVQGQWNFKCSNNSNIAHIIGNGTSNQTRSNAHTLDWDGNAWFSGDVYVGSTSGTNKDEGSKKLATEEYVDTNLSEFIEQAKALANWDNISNKPTTIPSPAKQHIVIPFTEYEISDESQTERYIHFDNYNPNTGLKKYSFFLNGVEYESLVYYKTINDISFYYIGNSLLIGDDQPSNGELPFLVVMPEDISKTMTVILSPNLPAGTYSFYMTQEKQPIKYLSDEYLDCLQEEEKETIFHSKVDRFEEEIEGIFLGIFEFDNALEVGKQYELIFNGRIFQGQCEKISIIENDSDSTFLTIGNNGLGNPGVFTDTGEDFLFVNQDNMFMCYVRTPEPPSSAFVSLSKLNYKLKDSYLSDGILEGKNLLTENTINLLNPDTCTNGYTIEKNGLVATANYSCSDYIEVDGSKTYSFRGKFGGGVQIVLYDADKNYIWQYYDGQTTSGSYATGYMVLNLSETYPNTRYVRVNMATAAVGSVYMIVEGSEYPAEYIPFVKKQFKNEDIKEVINEMISDSQMLQVGEEVVIADTAQQSISIGNEAGGGQGNAAIAIGTGALKYLADNDGTDNGRFNTAIGHQAMREATTADHSTAVGYQAMRSCTTGDYNTAVGEDAAMTLVDGNRNVAIGCRAMQSQTTGDDNVAVGAMARYFDMANKPTGSRNTVVGARAGDSGGAGSDCVHIGYGAKNFTAGLNNTIAIGSNAKATKENQTVIGNESTVETVIRGNLLVKNPDDSDAKQVVATAPVEATDAGKFLQVQADGSWGAVELDSIVLKSENKKFRLTINDEGVLSATEIV